MHIGTPIKYTLNDDICWPIIRLFSKVILLFTFFIACYQQTVKILFDATKAETANNADCIIDAHLHNLGWNPNGKVGGGSEANAQKLPTPLQIDITSSTIETYWNGALSA